MSKSSPKQGTHPVNPKRAIAKAKRGFGQNVMKGDAVAWSQSKDPLFKIKGLERFKRVKGYING